MSATSAIAILAVFVLLDACKHWISHARGTGHAWLLQQDIIALRRSIARGSASPRAAAAAAAAAAAPSDPDRARPFVSVAHARERLLRDKERALTRAQTPALRRAMFLSHYLHVAKGVFGVGVVLALWSGDEPLFEVQRNAVWPLGRWLAAPHGQSWEAGAVAVTPWTLLSAAASVALCEGVVGPLIVRVVRAAGGGGKRGERFAAFESESESDRESDHAHVGARGGGRGGSRKTR